MKRFPRHNNDGGLQWKIVELFDLCLEGIVVEISKLRPCDFDLLVTLPAAIDNEENAIPLAIVLMECRQDPIKHR